MSTDVTHSLRPALSIVSTLYNSRRFLDEFLRDCLEALAEAGCKKYEIVLVNDGSPDDSLGHALSLKRDIPELVIVDLSRNFGHHQALQAGIQHARGELVFIIDSDLEVAPAVLPDFLRRQRESGADLVYGYQESRMGGWFERISGALFWKGFNWMSETKIPENILTAQIMTRRFLDGLLQMGDRNLFLVGMLTWTGFDQIGIPVAKKRREGLSNYSLSKRLRLTINAVSSFSSQPLIWLFNVGVTITVLSIGFAAYLVVRKLLFNDALLGFTSMMAMMALSLGIMTTGLGTLGIYLGRIFRQVQNRPNYIVKDIYR
jgi:putative glycosyltransferase